jgi:hypothetical protein
MTAYSSVGVWCSDDSTQWVLEPRRLLVAHHQAFASQSLSTTRPAGCRASRRQRGSFKTVQSRPTAKEMRAQTLSLACPRQRRATRSVPDLTSAGDLSFLQKHHAMSELGFSPLFVSRRRSSFLSSRTVPEKFSGAGPCNTDYWESHQRSISRSAPLAGVAGNRQKTDDLRREHLHKRHRREDHCVADIRALGRRHLGRIHKNGGISRRAGRHAD